MAVTNGLLVTGLLRLLDKQLLALDDPVCHYWDGFIRFGKQDITIKDLLTHKAGLHRSLPLDLKLSNLVDYDSMISILEDTPYYNNNSRDFKGQYAYLTSGWCFSEVIRGVTGIKIEEYMKTAIIKKLSLSDDIYYPIPETLSVTERDIMAKYNTNNLIKKNNDEIGTTNNLILNKTNQKENFQQQNNLDIELKKNEISTTVSLESNDNITTRQRINSNGSSNTDFFTYELDYEDIAKQQCFETESNKSLKNEEQDKTPMKIDNNKINYDKVIKSPWLEGKELTPLKLTHNEKIFYPFEDFNQQQNINLSSNKKVCITKSQSKDVISRLVQSRREIGVPRVKSDEVKEKLAAVKKNNRISRKFPSILENYPSKYIDRSQLMKNNAKTEKAPYVSNRGSPIELLSLKPHVLDPLIYDSAKVLYHSIPPMNCRCTARGLARFYDAVNSGKIIKKSILEEASRIHLIDESFDSIILTGGGSCLWGLGYQLYPCYEIPGRSECKPKESLQNNHSLQKNGDGAKFVTFNPENEKRPQISEDNFNYFSEEQKVYMGIGHGDFGGSIALTIPELNLSIAILLNDVVLGPIASKEILTFILRLFGLEPAWNTRYNMNSTINDIEKAFSLYMNTDLTPGTTALREEINLFDISSTDNSYSNNLL